MPDIDFDEGRLAAETGIISFCCPEKKGGNLKCDYAVSI